MVANMEILENFTVKMRKDITKTVSETQKNKDSRCIATVSVLRAPSGARTLDPNIKSVVLYQLS